MTKELYEYEELRLLMDWIKFVPSIADIALHIPNEGKRTPLQGERLRRIGVKAGVSDVFIPYPTKKYHGLWIEMKRQKSWSVSDQQMYWIERMNKLGYYAEIANGFEVAKEIIERYLSGE